MKKIIIAAVIGLFASFLFLVAAVQAKEEFYQYPNIKDDFCGVAIGAQYCKCAFHGEQCDAVNLDKKGADTKVNTEFINFLRTKIEVFARSCMNAGGIYSVIKTSCEYCEGGKVRSNGVCADPKDVRPIEEIYGLPKVETTGGSNVIGYVVRAEGEFFVFSPGREKWIGPVQGGMTLYEGDVLFTTQNGRAQLRIGNTNTLMLGRTIVRLSSPEKKRTALERGVLFVWETVKRLVNNQPFEIEEGGGQSVAGSRGTKFLIEVNDASAKYTVNEGIIDVWKKDKPLVKTEVKAGESVEAKISGVAKSSYDWDTLVEKYELANQDLSEPVAVKPFPPINPDAVYPPEAAYTGDLVGKAGQGSSQSSPFWTRLIIIVVLAGGAFYFFKKRLKT